MKSSNLSGLCVAVVNTVGEHQLQGCIIGYALPLSQLQLEILHHAVSQCGSGYWDSVHSSPSAKGPRQVSEFYFFLDLVTHSDTLL